MNTTQTNERDGSRGQVAGVAEIGSHKLSLFDRVKIELRERIALATAERVKQGKPISEWRRAILEDHEETKELEGLGERIYKASTSLKNLSINERVEVASNSNTSEDVLNFALFNDKSPKVRIAVCGNVNTPEGALRQAQQHDADKDVKWVAGIAINAHYRENMTGRAQFDSWMSKADAVAMHSIIHATTDNHGLDRIDGGLNEIVEELAANGHMTTCLDIALKYNADERIRMEVALHGSISDEALKYAVENDDSAVVKMVAEEKLLERQAVAVKQPQSQFQWRQDRETGVVIIKDNGIDGRSVTNDAPAVLKSLRDFMGKDVFDKLPAVIYHDSMGRIDGMVYQPESERVSFYPVAGVVETHNSKREAITILPLEYEAIKKAVTLGKGSVESKDRRAVLDLLQARDGSELDLESVNAAIAEGMTRHIEERMPSDPAILVDSKTGKASFGSMDTKGENAVVLTRFDGNQLGEIPTVEQIEAGCYKNYVQECGIAAGFQRLYEQAREQENGQERE